jgi:hypothetical protein
VIRHYNFDKLRRELNMRKNKDDFFLREFLTDDGSLHVIVENETFTLSNGTRSVTLWLECYEGTRDSELKETLDTCTKLRRAINLYCDYVEKKVGEELIAREDD